MEEEQGKYICGRLLKTKRWVSYCLLILAIKFFYDSIK